jgi:GNAT superfamily N-acetyltransferase
VRVVDGERGLAGAAVVCGKWLRLLLVDRQLRRRGIGSALFADAAARGIRIAAAEPGNYFVPGVPVSDVASVAFLRRQRFIETRTTWNLDVGLDELPELSRAEVHRPSHEEQDRVLAFVERAFGRIWRFEATKAFASELPKAFVTEVSGEVTGFAVHDVNNRGLGFFGPTGVESSMRGRGLGCALLLASLRDLRRLGYARAVIPWTDALDFYRKCCGAAPAHRFATYEKPS